MYYLIKLLQVKLMKKISLFFLSRVPPNIRKSITKRGSIYNPWVAGRGWQYTMLVDGFFS